MEGCTKQHMFTQLIRWYTQNFNQLGDEYWPAVVSVITALHPTSLLSVDIIMIFLGFLLLCSILCHDFCHGFFFMSPFLFYLFIFCCYCVCLFPLLHLCAGCKTAVELRWEVRELQKHQGEQVIYVCVCMFMSVCSTAQWFDFMQH